MRLHRLTLQAFGPFAGREEVDFDALSGAGLFLLHGPTGAGKTSVLDAVCYALYGVVPGVRAASARLRSDHAAEGLAPEIRCEFSVGPRRFEVTRSPAWERPKRRGEGTTTEQAKVLVRELVAGGWTARATRIDEAAHLLQGILGLGHDQFTKLVLLPQGEFAAFLRSDAETRRSMLEKLFDTDRFSAVQQWLRDTHTQIRHELDEARTVTRELLARADQAASRLPRLPGDDPNDPNHPNDSQSPDEPGTPREQVAQHLARALRSWEDATSRRAATTDALGRARRAHSAGLELARHRSDHDRLATAARRLAEDGPAQQERRTRLRNAERALGVAPVAPQLTDAEEALDDARARLDRAVAVAAADAATLTGEGGLDAALAVREVLLLDAVVLAGFDDATLAGASRTLRERTGQLRAIARDAAGLPEAVTLVQQLKASVDHERQALADAAAGAAALGPALSAEAERLAQARVLAQGLPAAVDALDTAEAASAAVRDRDRLAAGVAAAEPACRQARTERDTARQHWLDLRERRLTQMAAELADALRPGCPCPVCGSPEHPAPAPSGPDRVTEAQEQAARATYEQAEAVFAARERALREAAEGLARVSGAAGGLDAAEATARVETARAAVEAARSAQEGVAGREDTVARIVAAAERADGVIEAARARLNEREGELAACTAAVADLHARVAQAQGDDPSLAVRTTRLESAAKHLDDVIISRREHADALRAAAAARRTALAAAREAGFGDLQGALEAVLPEGERLELERRVRAHDSELAAVSAQLADPVLVAAADQPPPDVAQLTAAEVHAQGDDEACAQQIALAEEAVTQLRRIETLLAEHLTRAEPLERRHRTTADLARCADGTGGENTRRMSLSAYVLAARLEQVAQAASLRLAQMSGGRYTLVHTDDLARGTRRSGLGLHVVDAWTGVRRDTTSLSGGESFYTSLALALGLADVVSAEAGGTAIETLFVDEGFGSLDDDTLEEVMDVLDGLRSGGRAVGLVSHVADLRQRIPAQIEVVKGRDGSHLHVGAS